MAFNNKHAIVTGGGSGVGAAIALKLAEDNVCLLYTSDAADE